MRFNAQMPSPLGNMLLSSNGSHLTGAYFIGQSDCPSLAGATLSARQHGGPSDGLMAGLPIKNFKVRRVDQADLFASVMPLEVRYDISALEPGRSPGETLEPSRQVSSLTMHPDTPDRVQALFEQVQQELNDYFAGRRQSFTVALHIEGSEFQKRVWQALREIPYGESATYGDVARAAGLTPQHGRPVGTAVGRNPISIIIPCHRVLGAGSILTGYTGGLERKLLLLQREGFTLG